MVRCCGACFGLLAFAVTILAGLYAGNPVTTTLSRSLWAMVAFLCLGSFLGYVALRVVDEHAVRRRNELFGDPDAEEPSDDGASRPKVSRSNRA
ncbi:MAG: hypothetical protein JXA69_12115 [Phycisphaerae bacterium]|nr:hypothetical protein [Phycisphaerae bacterium]